ncbi:tectonic-1 [Brienomyrus brachyistius]|uniref:tectonic-1 n=1 Tax=Brienomyrus brachyistius TaxID=42636 RepID=UPI0020B2C8F5|nr:tectonic-1 [Brienomyrus brachyistius]
MRNGLLCILIFCIFKNAAFVADADKGYFNFSTNATEALTDINGIFNSTETGDNATTVLPARPETSPTDVESSVNTVSNEATGVTETVPRNLSPADDSSKASVSTGTPPTAVPTAPPGRPLPVSGSLPPAVTDVSSVCPCNVLQDRCDINCCCDPDCGEEAALFTSCSVELIITDKRMCRLETARYSLIAAEDGPARVQASIEQETNANIFCIHSANYEEGLSFGNIEVPTNGNFAGLFQRFVGFFFSSNPPPPDKQASRTGPGYTYGDTIQTEDEARRRTVFCLPAPAGTAHCSDANPAAFLTDQSTQCIRSFALVRDCATLPALSLQRYAGFSVLSMKNDGSNVVAVETSSISLQSLEGTRTLLGPSDGSLYSPVLLERPGSAETAVCNNVVLQVRYVVTYSEAGTILGCSASFVLGAVNSSMLPIQQDFEIVFVQDSAAEIAFPSSGNPGYVVGLPLVAGSRTADGIVQSTNTKGSLTLLKSSASQDCLAEPLPRSPIVFGLSMVSGCTLRLEDAGNCSVVSEVLLKVLRGQEFPQYVASFGNSQPQMVTDWVPIKTQTTPTLMQGCTIPVSRDIEVSWTKYGSLVNPQAHIVNVTEVIRSSSSLSLTGGNRVALISTSVTFVDVSAPPQPGYRAPPTIDAKLPFDFFFPFV